MKYFRCVNCGFFHPITNVDYEKGKTNIIKCCCLMYTKRIIHKKELDDVDKLYVLITNDPSKEITSIFETYLKRGIITNFDHLEIKREYNKINSRYDL